MINLGLGILFLAAAVMIAATLVLDDYLLEHYG